MLTRDNEVKEDGAITLTSCLMLVMAVTLETLRFQLLIGILTIPVESNRLKLKKL